VIQVELGAIIGDSVVLVVLVDGRPVLELEMVVENVTFHERSHFDALFNQIYHPFFKQECEAIAVLELNTVFNYGIQSSNLIVFKSYLNWRDDLNSFV